MMHQKELDALIATEEKRLGVNSQKFMERHNEIMSLIEQAKKSSCQCREHQQE